jgi:site-specific recombinase XerD
MDKIVSWLDYLHSQRGLAPSTQREYHRDMRLLIAHLVDQDSRHFLPGVVQQHGPITAEHLAAFLVHPIPPRAWSFPDPNRPYQRGANLREVQELLGHASPTTATYTHIANRGLHDAVARLAETLVDWLDRQRHR